MIPRVVVTAVIIILSSVLSDAAPTNCIGKVFEYGSDFDLTKVNKTSAAETWETKNPHGADGALTWKNIHWNRGWVTTRECEACSPKIGVTALFVTSDEQGLPCGLNKGMLIDDIIELMGKPDKRNESSLTYFYPPIDRNEEIVFQFKEGKLLGIKWNFYND